MPRAAPRRCSASTARSDSLAKAIGTGRSSACGQAVAERLVAPAEVRRHRHHPVAPADHADDRRPGSHEGGGRRAVVRGSWRPARRAQSAMSSTLERPRGRSIRRSSSGRPPSPTAAAASESTAISSASTIAPVESGRTTGEGLPGVPSRAAGLSLARSPATSSPIEAADRAAGQPGAGDEVGAGHRAALMELPDDGAQVRPTDRFAAMSELVATTQQGLCSSFSNVCARLVQPRGHVKTEDHGAVGCGATMSKPADRRPVDGRHRDPEGHPGDAPGRPASRSWPSRPGTVTRHAAVAARPRHPARPRFIRSAP